MRTNDLEMHPGERSRVSAVTDVVDFDGENEKPFRCDSSLGSNFEQVPKNEQILDLEDVNRSGKCIKIDEVKVKENNESNGTCVNAVVSVVIALFYTGLIIVSVLVCLYSIKSLYYTSNIPVTSTTIIQQDQSFQPPVLLLMFSTDKVGQMCECKYNFAINDETSSCDTYVLKSNSERYLSIMNETLHQEVLELIKQHSLPKHELFVEMSFLYFKGPSHWRKLDTLLVTCELDQWMNGSTPITFANNPIVEYLFLPSWDQFMSYPESQRDIAVYEHLREHPGMRFFPFGFDNFVLISRTEIWDVDSTFPDVRLQTEISLSLIDKLGFIGEKNSSAFVVEVQWKDGLVTQVKSVITATIWTSVSVVCTMLLMLEKAYGYGTRIYASIKSEREKKKIQKQMRQQREVAQTTWVGLTSTHCNAPTGYNPVPSNHRVNSQLANGHLNPTTTGGSQYKQLATCENNAGMVDEDDACYLDPSLPESYTRGQTQGQGQAQPNDQTGLRHRLVRENSSYEISALSLSKLHRNMIEISAILEESGVKMEYPLSFANNTC